PCAGDAHEARVLHLLDGRRAAVAHRLAQAADELVENRRKRALVGNTTLDPFGDELLRLLDVTLEVAVLRVAATHRAEGFRAAVLLETLALMDDHVAGRLVGPGEHRAEHHRVGAGPDRLRDVPGRRDPAVADHRHLGHLGGVVDRRELWNADARDDTRGAD